MRIKNIYIYTKDYERDFNFIRKDKKEHNIDDKDIFTDMTFENAVKQDVTHGLYGWDAVRILDPIRGETFIVEINGKLKFYHKFND